MECGSEEIFGASQVHPMMVATEGTGTGCSDGRDREHGASLPSDKGVCSRGARVDPGSGDGKMPHSESANGKGSDKIVWSCQVNLPHVVNLVFWKVPSMDVQGADCCRSDEFCSIPGCSDPDQPFGMSEIFPALTIILRLVENMR